MGVACGCGTPPAPTPTVREPDWFVDRAEATGLTFTHVNGMSGRFHYAEIIGSGAAMFDMDNDGDLDVFLVQYKGQSRLFRSNLETGTLSFTDVTPSSGIVSAGNGMGVAAGDFDNDGCTDLYLTNRGPNQLWKNNCDGTFTDVSKKSGTAGAPGDWSVSAAWFDYDRDGWPDLFVTHYLNWDEATATPCHSASGRPDYCSPNVYQPQPSRLYHNNRNGTFTDVTAAAGISREFGPALGVSTADIDGDGWPDIYVANDGQPNQLWINQRNGTFKNTALLAGAAVGASGKAKGSMGVDAGDFDGDGDDDLVMTELTGEGANLFVNDGTGMFDERGVPSGLAALTTGHTGFGAAWIDFDNDGRLDVLTVNGAVRAIEALARAGDPFPLRQRKLLLKNSGNGRFEDVSGRAGAVFRQEDVGRGAAFGDIDNDGDIDVVVNNNNGRAQLLINNVGTRNHWIGVKAAPGARVRVTREDGTSMWRRARADGSYASSNDPRVVAGLGSSSHPVRLRVVWPDGTSDDRGAFPADHYVTLTESRGK